MGFILFLGCGSCKSCGFYKSECQPQGRMSPEDQAEANVQLFLHTTTGLGATSAGQGSDSW